MPCKDLASSRFLLSLQSFASVMEAFLRTMPLVLLIIETRIGTKDWKRGSIWIRSSVRVFTRQHVLQKLS